MVAIDELEQANIESGLRWLARHRGEVLTDDFAITLHKRLFGEVWDWAGSWSSRSKAAFITLHQTRIRARQVAYSHSRYVGRSFGPRWVENLPRQGTAGSISRDLRRI